MKSVSTPYEMVGSSAGAAVAGTDIAKIEWPSGTCLRTSLAATVVTPPGRFSTMTRQPSCCDSSDAMIRLMMSGGVLAVFGTTMRMGRDGKASALGAGAAGIASRPARNAARTRWTHMLEFIQIVLVAMG